MKKQRTPKKLKRTPLDKTIKKHKQHSKITSINIIILTLAIIAIFISITLYIENKNLQEEYKNKQSELKKAKQLKELEEKKAKYFQQIKAFEEKTKALDIEYTDTVDTQTYIEEPKQKIKEHIFEEPTLFEEEIRKEKKVEEKLKAKEIKQKQKETKKEIVTNKPKLAIIIDDVTTKSQVNKIKDIGYTVNIAYLPTPNMNHDTSYLTKGIDNYMIHLPLQATNNKFDEPTTLHTNDSLSTIENRIKELKALYPKAKFINNHTGSKFTENKEAMDKLFQILKKYEYTFIDSKTTSHSVSLISAKKYGLRVLRRNIFLDNKKDSKYIQNQLKKAVKIAKMNGEAIAIGHPYNSTLKTLKNSKELLKDVEVVFVDKL